MLDMITQSKTTLPIGRSGFYFAEDVQINDLSVESTKKIPRSRSLYEVRLHGLRLHSSDETGTVHASAWDMIIFDSDDQELHDGYASRMNKNLFAIFNTQSCFVGWPADDEIIIKDVSSGTKTNLHPQAPVEDGKITRTNNLFIFEGELWDCDCCHIPCRKKKHWRAFVNAKGQIVYDGWCWEYSIENNILTIKRGRTSKALLSINV